MGTSGESGWDSTEDQATYYTFSRTETIAKRSDDDPNEKGRNECNNIPIGNVVLGQFEIGFESHGSEGRKSVPRQKRDEKPEPGE
jgi:hypothetical protein